MFSRPKWRGVGLNFIFNIFFIFRLFHALNLHIFSFTGLFIFQKILIILDFLFDQKVLTIETVSDSEKIKITKIKLTSF